MKKKITKLFAEKNILSRIFYLFFGCFIIAFFYNSFLVPNHIVYGGMSGLAIVISDITGMSTTLFLNIVTFLLLVISFFILGPKETSYALIGFIVYDIMINLTEPLASMINVQFDSFLFEIIFYATLTGIGSGLLYKTNFNTGGADSIIAIAQHFFKIPVSNLSNIINGVIILVGASTFGIVKSIYAVIFLKVMNFVSNRVLIGVSDSKLCLISTKHKENLEEYISNELELGYTLIPSTNGIGILPKTIIMCIVPSDRFYDLRNEITHLDKKARIITSDCYMVIGGNVNKVIKI